MRLVGKEKKPKQFIKVLKLGGSKRKIIIIFIYVLLVFFE